MTNKYDESSIVNKVDFYVHHVYTMYMEIKNDRYL